MESAKDFLLKACEMADGVVLADSPASRDRMIAGLVGHGGMKKVGGSLPFIIPLILTSALIIWLGKTGSSKPKRQPLAKEIGDESTIWTLRYPLGSPSLPPSTGLFMSDPANTIKLYLYSEDGISGVLTLPAFGASSVETEYFASCIRTWALTLTSSSLHLWSYPKLTPDSPVPNP
jgi:hypothetical protein